LFDVQQAAVASGRRRWRGSTETVEKNKEPANLSQTKETLNFEKGKERKGLNIRKIFKLRHVMATATVQAVYTPPFKKEVRGAPPAQPVGRAGDKTSKPKKKGKPFH